MVLLKRRGTHFGEPGSFGRIPSVPDPLNSGFRLRALTGISPTAGPPPNKRIFRLDWRGNQGNTSQCVGFSTFGMLKATPSRAGKLTPEGIYQGAQQYDEWPGEGYDGSSVHGAMKFLKDYTPVQDVIAYYWAASHHEVLNWMSDEVRGSPVVIGVNWYEKMNLVNGDGFIIPKGSIVGGHAIVVIGYNIEKNAFLLQNSWGPEWNRLMRGRCWLSFKDFDVLMKEDGEAAVATKYVVPKPVVVK